MTFGKGSCGMNTVGSYQVPVVDYVKYITATIRSDDHAILYVNGVSIADRFDCVWDDEKTGNYKYQTCKFKRELSIKNNPVAIKVEVFNTTQACGLESGKVTFHYY